MTKKKLSIGQKWDINVVATGATEVSCAIS